MGTHRRHDITDKVWELLEPHLPGRAGGWGGVAHDNRQFINAVFWIMRTGAPWRDLPLTMVTGVIPIVALLGGVTKASGRS